MATLAMPRNRRNPNTSVKVVNATAEATAGLLQYVVETEVLQRQRSLQCHVALHRNSQHKAEAWILLPGQRDSGD